jgi:hypothetical protein
MIIHKTKGNKSSANNNVCFFFEGEGEATKFLVDGIAKDPKIRPDENIKLFDHHVQQLSI